MESPPHWGSYLSLLARSFPVLGVDVAAGSVGGPANRFARLTWLHRFRVPPA